MSSVVQICNQALANINARATIASLTESSVSARACQIWYEPSRRKALEVRGWGFARKRIIGAEHSSPAPTAQWQYRYQYPSDAVRVREMEHGINDFTQPFEIEIADDSTKSIVTNVGDATIVYTFDQEDTAFFTPTFTDALAWLIASKIAVPVTGSPQLADYANKQYETALRTASGVAEGQQISPLDATWISGRN